MGVAVQPMMQAIAATAWGGPEVLQLVEVPVPSLSLGDVLVRVEAAGVNPTDWKSRATGGRKFWRDPAILGFDIAGVVEAVADGSNLLSCGDRVFGMPRFPLPAEGYAQYAAAPARQLARMPAGLTFSQAASLPLAGLTALQALEEAGKLKPGQSVLVCAAGGGVGRLAVQIAVALGAVVTACARAERLGDAATAGATVVEAAHDGTPAIPSRHDVVIDPFGGERTKALLDWCAPGGILVSLIPRTDPAVKDAARARGIVLRRVVVEPSGAGMERIAQWVEKGRLRSHVALALPLTDAAQAHRAGERGGLDGKIVLQPWHRSRGRTAEGMEP
ncbi:NADP-dependent oxidoreductase [Cryobacterium sp. TMT1-66-1]|uniref:NADP-dependent oxidoreductase n=1 Tax=Cryobacterium sp. TMT1-66-1 TaxID=1259242 RepID=UPI0018E074CC|nr:NADP-dependent oxidoreductase [Cryobacterium sp. TMT1-66-1]